VLTSAAAHGIPFREAAHEIALQRLKKAMEHRRFHIF
jgi:hypothetical protein